MFWGLNQNVASVSPLNFDFDLFKTAILLNNRKWKKKYRIIWVIATAFQMALE